MSVLAAAGADDPAAAGALGASSLPHPTLPIIARAANVKAIFFITMRLLGPVGSVVSMVIVESRCPVYPARRSDANLFHAIDGPR